MDKRPMWQCIWVTSMLAIIAFALASLTPSAVIAVEASIRLESASLEPGESVRLALDGLGFDSTGVGAITVDVSYDPKTVLVTACDADPEEVFDVALCNQKYAEGVVRVTAIDAQGEAGAFSLAEITFTAGTETGTQALRVRVETLADPTGNELGAVVANGALTIAGDSTGAESRADPGEKGTNSGSGGEQDGSRDEATSNEQSSQSGEASDGDTSAESSGAEAEEDQARGSADEDSEPGESGNNGTSDASSEVTGGDSGSGFRWWYAAVAVSVVAVAAIGIAFARSRRQV